MTCMYMNNDHTMSYHASACAAAASSCAHMSAMCSAANMTLARILDAIIMASIIICLICCLIAAAFAGCRPRLSISRGKTQSDFFQKMTYKVELCANKDMYQYSLQYQYNVWL